MASPPPADDRTRLIARLVAEKRRILRLVRALDRSGISSKSNPALGVPLVRLAEFDGLLTSTLEFVDRDPSSGSLAPSLDRLLATGEEVRGEVRDALDAEDAEAVRRADDDVTATEAEIWHEIAQFRAQPKPKRAKKRAPPMVSEKEASRLAAKMAEGPPPPSARDRAALEAEEARPLPAEDAPLVAWLRRLPPAWLATTATLHEVPTSTDAAEGVAARLSDAAWLRSVVAERLGRSEREWLTWFVAAGSVPLGAKLERVESLLAVDWTWRLVPATAGGKLRAAGLVYVGTRAGARVAEVPPPLRAPLAALLREIDPEAAAAPDRAIRANVAETVDGAPYETAELTRWKAIDRALMVRFSRWTTDAMSHGDAAERAFSLVFGPGARVVRSELENAALLQFFLFDWRSAPDAPTAAQRRLATDRFASAEERTLAAAIVAAPPAIYRIGVPERGRTLPLVPVFPEGPEVVVSDRALSLTAEPGWLIGCRVYEAGPFRFAHVVGDPVRADGERRLVRGLERELQEFVRAGGEGDAPAFVRARPDAVIRALRRARQ